MLFFAYKKEGKISLKKIPFKREKAVQRKVKDLELQILMKGADRMLDYKNPEGYSDPTPYHALADSGRRYMPLVYICSPYSGDVAGNIERARVYCRLAVDQGAIPIAPHLLFPQFMSEETERDLAMFMDIAILSHCKELWVFGEPSAGMRQEIAYAERKHMTIKYFNKEDT